MHGVTPYNALGYLMMIIGGFITLYTMVSVHQILEAADEEANEWAKTAIIGTVLLIIGFILS